MERELQFSIMLLCTRTWCASIDVHVHCTCMYDWEQVLFHSSLGTLYYTCIITKTTYIVTKTQISGKYQLLWS
jgi:hypothetical protein